MATIYLETLIDAPKDRVFDLARSLDLHMDSTPGSNERVIAGRPSGLIELGETVSWRAKHFGVYQTLTSKIIAYKKPDYFIDMMIEGTFATLWHKHTFESTANGTKMIDWFIFESPLGELGKVAEALFLKRYLTNVLVYKSNHLKAVAESEDWKKYLMK